MITIRRVSPIVFLAFAVAIGLLVLMPSGHEAASGAATSANESALTTAIQRYAILRDPPAPSSTAESVSAPGPSSDWVKHVQATLAARGDRLDAANVHRAVSSRSVSVDVFASRTQLCFKVAQLDGSGSVDCTELSDLLSGATTMAGPVSVDRTDEGMQVTLLAPDGTSDVQLVIGSRGTSIRTIGNIATVATTADFATLRWVDPNGTAHEESFPRP